jgi:predicted acyl esterase
MIVIDKDVMVPMTDGVRLATDVFRPHDGPPSPVLLVRTPYGKDQMTIGGSDSFDILRSPGRVRGGHPGRPRPLRLRRRVRA